MVTDMRQDFDQKPGRLIGPLYEPPAARASFAVKAGESRGRFYGERESATRTPYQRDRDRIIHSTAFRRLKHKTQVFVQHEGDYYRTRLTHSLEVAQIARALARVLALDEDLAETVALSHDLGHTPFGHAGEDALSAATTSIGGFDHNAHALRLVTKLEHRYAEFDGLNLTWETLEGIVKHNGPLKAPVAMPIASFDARWPLDLKTWPSLEAQIAALSDDIAYVNHDIDDGLRAGLFTMADLAEAPLAGPQATDVQKRWPDLDPSRFIGELVRTLIGSLVDDLLAETRRRIADARPASADQVRHHPGALVSFSVAMDAQVRALKKFLFERMYRHPRVMRTMDQAKDVVAELFEAFSREPSLLPQDWAGRCGAAGDSVTGGVVRDYIAGMTDNFALSEYARIFHKEIALAAP
jgi:dGTPase